MKQKLTPFGKYFRKIRAEKHMSLIQASELLGVSKTYLSLIEYGEKDIPIDFKDKIIKKFKLDGAQCNELAEAIESTPCNRKISVDDLERVLINFVNNTCDDAEEKNKALDLLKIEINKFKY